ncbi:gibberellin-regulated protein 14-like [Citrus clementina]|nr:gibberellin-regulated protein 14-like [Citrus x clementina]
MYLIYNAQEITKLDAKSRRCIFLGYTDGVKGYRLWDPTAHKIVISRDVIFIEDQLQRRDEDNGTTKEKSETVPVYVENNLEDSDSSEAAPEHEEQEPIETETLEFRRSTRERRPPAWHSEYVTKINVAYCLLTEDGEPSTFHEALESSDSLLSVLSNNEEEYLLEKDATYPKTPVPAPAPPKAPVKPITPPPVVKPPTTYPPPVKPPTTTPPVVKLPTVAPAPPVKPPTVMPTPPLKPPPTYPPPVKPPTTTPPPVSPPKTAPAPQVPSPASSPMPIVRSNKDCIPLCAARCKAHSRPNIFGRACTTCCVRCKCVPPGTYGNREKCGKCYTGGNKPKCP